VFLSQLPTESEVAALIDSLRLTSEAAGVTINSFSQGTAQSAVQNVRAIGFTVAADGTFVESMGFIDELENLQRFTRSTPSACPSPSERSIPAEHVGRLHRLRLHGHRPGGALTMTLSRTARILLALLLLAAAAFFWVNFFTQNRVLGEDPETPATAAVPPAPTPSEPADAAPDETDAEAPLDADVEADADVDATSRSTPRPRPPSIRSTPTRPSWRRRPTPPRHRSCRAPRSSSSIHPSPSPATWSWPISPSSSRSRPRHPSRRSASSPPPRRPSASSPPPAPP
jgi:hypothetical protein